MLGALHVAKALGGDGAHGRECILDAMVKLLQDQLLELVGRLALAGVDASLSEQTMGIDFGLREKKPKADILRLEKFVGRRPAMRRALALVTVNFEHHRLFITISQVPHTPLGSAVTAAIAR